nr:immunoglobulin light chain junction region [Macaca mulatta]
CGQGIYLPTF